jgi:DNA-binding NtrC family response regulator
MKRRLLLVEDDEVFLRPLLRTLELKGYEVLPVQSGEEALEAVKAEDVDLVLTDRRLPGMDGVELVRQIKTEHPDLAVVVMTAYGTIESAVEAMRLGAEDYLVKPFEAAELLLVIRRAIEFQELKSANRRTIRRNQERFTFGNIVAASAGMQGVFDLLRSVVDLDTTVLIYGETGTGKELLARSIHFSGARRERPFVAVI